MNSQGFCIKLRLNVLPDKQQHVFQDALNGTHDEVPGPCKVPSILPPEQVFTCSYRLSTAKESEFPLAPVSLNITKWTLQMVHERKLTSAAKKQQSAVTAASDFYVGTFYTLYNHWKDKKCTMADSGFVLKEIEKRACSNVMNMVRRAGTTL